MCIEVLVVGINEYVFEFGLNFKVLVKDVEVIVEMLEKYGNFYV